MKKWMISPGDGHVVFDFLLESRICRRESSCLMLTFATSTRPRIVISKRELLSRRFLRDGAGP